MEEIKEEPLEKLEDYFYRYFSIPSYDGIPAEKRLGKKEWLQAYTNLAVSKERERRDAQIIEFINSGEPAPWNDTGWSVELSDVEKFIKNTK